MTSDTRADPRKSLLVIAIVAIVGILGLSLLFSDLGTREAPWIRGIEIAAVYSVGGFLVGRIVPRTWYVAGVAALGPIALGLLVLASRIVRGGSASDWIWPVSTILGPLAVCLGAAWLGARGRIHGRTVEAS